MLLVNVYATHRDPLAPPFPHTPRARRDRSDARLAEHLHGFAGYVTARGQRPMTATLYAVLRHLERVRHHVALEVADDHLDALASWALAVNAILFLPDGTVRAPDCAVLVASDTGAPDPGAEVPYPRDAIERKEATESTLAARGLTAARSLPPSVAMVEVDLRTPAEVAARSLALLACAIRADSIAAGDPWPVSAIRARFPRALDALSPKEEAFLARTNPDEAETTEVVWRYEAVVPLAWALGVIPRLPFPDSVSDVPELVRAIETSLDGRGALRPPDELLDALDLHYRLHWITTDARVQGAPAPHDLEPGVIAERHHALNWLTGFNDADWDDVDTPT